VVAAVVAGAAVLAVVGIALAVGGGSSGDEVDPSASPSSTAAAGSPPPDAAAPSTTLAPSPSTTVTEPEPATSSTLAAGEDPNPTVPDTTPEDAVDVDELRSLLLEEPAVAAVLPGASETGGGPLDLAGAADLELDASAERALLQTRHFEGGYNRSFDAPGGAVAYLQVYEFASAADAEAYLEDGEEGATAAGARPFEVPAIANAVGLTSVDETDQGAFTGHVVSFVRGARHWLVVVGGTDGAPSEADAADLAVAQLRRAMAAED
jgi:hypothetical protein